MIKKIIKNMEIFPTLMKYADLESIEKFIENKEDLNGVEIPEGATKEETATSFIGVICGLLLEAIEKHNTSEEFVDSVFKGADIKEQLSTLDQEFETPEEEVFAKEFSKILAGAMKSEEKFMINEAIEELQRKDLTVDYLKLNEDYKLDLDNDEEIKEKVEEFGDSLKHFKENVTAIVLRLDEINEEKSFDTFKDVFNGLKKVLKEDFFVEPSDATLSYFVSFLVDTQDTPAMFKEKMENLSFLLKNKEEFKSDFNQYREKYDDERSNVECPVVLLSELLYNKYGVFVPTDNEELSNWIRLIYFRGF